jgi:uncharacterized protein YdaT
MPWHSTYYPDSMKHLSPLIREKAIGIANALLREGHDEGMAIRIGIAKAKEWARHQSGESYRGARAHRHVDQLTREGRDFGTSVARDADDRLLVRWGSGRPFTPGCSR